MRCGSYNNAKGNIYAQDAVILFDPVKAYFFYHIFYGNI